MSNKHISLKALYQKIPKTAGCEQCIESDGILKHWCCRSSQPLVSKVEFAYIWSVVSKWSKGRLRQLFRRAVEGWADNRTTCPLYDEGCTIYDQRPMVCRVFGVEAESEYKSLKKQHRKTCSIVVEASGFRLTEQQKTEMWSGLQNLNEESIDHKMNEYDIPPITWEILLANGLEASQIVKIKTDSYASDFDVNEVLEQLNLYGT